VPVVGELTVDVRPDWKGGARHVASRAEWDMIVEEKAGPCRACGELEVSFHHIVPRSLGGDDVPANLIPLCGSGTTGCHGEYETRGLKWRQVCAAIRETLTDVEHDYVVGTKGEGFLERYYPLNRAELCPSCRRRRRQEAVSGEVPARRSISIAVPVSEQENGAELLPGLIEMAREKIGRKPGTPPYFTLVEALYVFNRDAQREAA